MYAPAALCAGDDQIDETILACDVRGWNYRGHGFMG
jgi:hypothetical protein